MDTFMKASRRKENFLVMFHGSVIVAYTICSAIGTVYFFASLIGFFLMILVTAFIYAYALNEI